ESDRILQWAQSLEPRRGNESIGRFVARDTAIYGRPHNGTGGLRTERKWHHAGPYSGRGTTGRPTRRMRRPQRVARRTGRLGSELSGSNLAEQYRTSAVRHPPACGIPPGAVPAV